MREGSTVTIDMEDGTYMDIAFNADIEEALRPILDRLDVGHIKHLRNGINIFIALIECDNHGIEVTPDELRRSMGYGRWSFARDLKRLRNAGYIAPGELRLTGKGLVATT